MIFLVGHLFILAVCLILQVIGLEGNTLGTLFTITSSLLTVCCIAELKNVDKTIKLLIIVGFILRVSLVIVDVFLVRLPESGFDDDSFYRTSFGIYEEGFVGLFQDVYGGFFSKMLACIYCFIGTSRLGIQYTNVLFFVIAAILLAKTMLNLKVSSRTSRIILALICLMPNAILHNAILRRETIIELCVCASIYWFSKWHLKKSHLFALLSVVFSVFASMFHTVFIFCALILLLYYALYDNKKQALSFSLNNTTKLIIVLICAIVAGLGFLSMFQNKFSSLDGVEDIYTTANRARGGSVYLQGYEVNTVGELILFTPLKLFYFLFSPVPWQFRNILDVVMFLSDTTVYIVLLIFLFRNSKNSESRLMLYIFVILAIIFALGTFNSGTAIRHRFSLLPFLLASFAIAKTQKETKTAMSSTKRHITGSPI